ncbi:glycosyltransferase family 2 protein [Urechidicola sp. KH5]
MQLAIVILNWNGKELLKQFLPSILKHSPNDNTTIYVADNASTDDSVAVVKKLFPTIKIIENSENFGFAKGYNEALKNIKADIYALVNSDIEVSPKWCDAILNQFKDAAIVAVQPKIKDYKNKSKFEYAGAAGGFLDAYGYPFCQGRIFDTVEKDDGQFDVSKEIFWASGACLFVRSVSFWQVGGFDSDFFAHQEEIDLCWRLNNLGYKIVYEPKSTVYHIGGATLTTGSPQKTLLNFRNSLWMLTKNLPKRKLYSRLFVRLSLDGIAAIRFLIQLKPKHFFAILKAHLGFYRKLRHNLKKREIEQRLDYYHSKNIVYQYFVGKRKKFKNLNHI